MPVVLDASLAFAIVTNEASQYDLVTIAAHIARAGAIAPQHWPLELANALTMAVRRRRLTKSERAECLADMAAFNVAIDTSPVDVFGALIEIADRYSLTLYDAAYIELADRTNSPLATFDKAMRAAAAREGISLLPA